MLSPIRHPSEQAQADLILIRARAALVEARTMLVNCARGLTKSYGERLRSCGTARVGEELAETLSEPARITFWAPLAGTATYGAGDWSWQSEVGKCEETGPGSDRTETRGAPAQAVGERGGYGLEMMG